MLRDHRTLDDGAARDGGEAMRLEMLPIDSLSVSIQGDDVGMITDLEGRVRNTTLPKTHALLPLHEAVVNAIQAIDTNHPGTGAGRVTVEILRSQQAALPTTPVPGQPALEPITGFIVTDDGVGFTDENLESFRRLDSRFKQDLGCRGVGRLLWLKAFNSVQVESTYVGDDGLTRSRSFSFVASDGVSDPDEEAVQAQASGTEVHLIGFKDEYQKSAPKTLEIIAREILEHCLWYFARPGGAPQVVVVDDGDAVDLGDLMDEYSADPNATSHFEIKGIGFDMVNLRRRSRTATVPTLHWCAASRVVSDENLTSKVPGLHARLRDDTSKFTFECYLSSAYLDNGVRSDRQAFDIPESVQGTLMEDDLSLEAIRRAAYAEIEKLLSPELSASREEGKRRVADFVAHKAPRYQPVLARFSEAELAIDPTVRDRDLELILHRQLQVIEHEVLEETQQIMQGAGSWQDDTYVQKVKGYLEKVEDMKKSDLAGYVTHRRVVLEILGDLLKTDPEGRYVREDRIHSLLMPMRTDSRDEVTEVSNLWIIDERLAFHDYLASDKTLRSMPITDSDSTKEPDLVALRVNEPTLVSEGTGMPLASIVVVEIKRPMRNDATTDDKNPISQALDYLERIRQGKVKTPDGRPIPESKSVPGFCYIIADLTETMVARCKDANLQPTADSMGYFGFNVPRGAYIEVISFDQLVKAAKERNRAFFDKLGLPV